MATVRLQHGLEDLTVTDVRCLEIEGIELSPDFIATLGDHPDRMVAIRKYDDHLEVRIVRTMTLQEATEFWS